MGGLIVTNLLLPLDIDRTNRFWPDVCDNLTNPGHFNDARISILLLFSLSSSVFAQLSQEGGESDFKFEKIMDLDLQSLSSLELLSTMRHFFATFRSFTHAFTAALPALRVIELISLRE